MTPEHESASPELAERESGLSYEPVYSSERETALAADPLEGYEEVPTKHGIKSEPRFIELAETLVSRGKPSLSVLWNARSGEVWKTVDLKSEFSASYRKQGYAQQEAGFKRYEARYIEPPYSVEVVKEVRPDYNQPYEVGLVTECDLISEPIPTDNPDYDPVSGEAVEAMLQSWFRNPQDPNGFGGNLENADWIRTYAEDIGLVIPEYGSDYLWAALRTSADGKELEQQAASIGHNARVYRQDAGLLRRANVGMAAADNELILVPLELKIG